MSEYIYSLIKDKLVEIQQELHMDNIKSALSGVNKLIETIEIEKSLEKFHKDCGETCKHE